MDLSRVFHEFETPSDEPWSCNGVRSRMVKYSVSLGHIVRVGTLSEQKLSTYRLIREAAEERRFEDAAALAEIFEHEANVIHSEFEHHIPSVRTFLLKRGERETTVMNADATILGKLRHPDGRPHESKRLWHEFRSETKELIRLAGAEDRDKCLTQCDAMKEHWRRLHDRDCDHLTGLLSEVMRVCGEEGVRDLWTDMDQWSFARRYSRYDVSEVPWEQSLGALLYITFESGRGHLMGPDRTGDVEFFEERDRWVWVWDPCGTCGRLVRGDHIEGTPPRMEPPYNWPVLGGPHEWAWGKKGVSVYGAQSCIKLAQIAIDAFGYPIRIVNCPTYPEGRNLPCYRYVYKDPALVPEEEYGRVGRARPEHFGSRRDVVPTRSA